jgi:hypothetical protein
MYEWGVKELPICFSGYFISLLKANFVGFVVGFIRNTSIQADFLTASLPFKREMV